MLRNSVRVLLFFAFWFSIYGFANPASCLHEGDLVELKHNETLYFDASPHRNGNKGDTFVVAIHRLEMQRLWIYDKDKNGKVIALNFPETAGIPYKGSSAKLRKLSSITRENRYLDAYRLTERLVGMADTHSSVGKLHIALKKLLSALSEQERLRNGGATIEKRILEREEKARKILGPKLLDSGTSEHDRERAQKLMKEASDLRDEFDDHSRKAESVVRSALQSLDLALAEIDAAQHSEPEVLASLASQIRQRFSFITPNQIIFFASGSFLVSCAFIFLNLRKRNKVSLLAGSAVFSVHSSQHYLPEKG
jgi:hypothetical protein